MKILFFSTDYWPDIGGIAAHVYYLSRALAEAGADVTVVGGHLAPISRSLNKPGGPGVFREITIQRKGPRFLRSLWFLLRAWWVLHRLQYKEWDVVHYHNFLIDGLLLGVLEWPKAKARVMTNHSDILLKVLDRRKNPFMLRLLVRRVNGIIGPSPELRDKSRVIQHPGQMLVYIPNGVDTKHFTPGLPTPESYQLLQATPEQKIILAVRRHDPKCGLDYLLKAVPKVVAKHSESVFCLVGDGVQTVALKQLAADLEIENFVRFLGRMSHEKLPLAFLAAYCSVIPSIYEAVSLSGLESLACGIPVIATKVGGNPEYVKPGHTGLLVEPYSADALADTLNYLLENPEERDRMAAGCVSFVAENFSWEAVAKQTLDFYYSLMGDK